MLAKFDEDKITYCTLNNESNSQHEIASIFSLTVVLIVFKDFVTAMHVIAKKDKRILWKESNKTE